MSDREIQPFVFEEPIGTERLLLRPLAAADLDAVHAYQGRDDVAAFQGFEPRSRAEVADWIARNAAARRLERDGDHVQPAVVRRRDGAVIGDLYLTLRSAAEATAELGWTLHPDAQGEGYATEGVRALLGVVFDRMLLHRAVAEVDPANAASIALCRRLGMREEGRFVQDVWFKGAWADTVVFAILDEEWRAR